MNMIVPLADVLGRGIRALRWLGFGPAQTLSDADIRGSGHLLAAGILGALWDRRQNPPDWAELSRRWEARVAASPDVDPTLYGSFDPRDRISLLADNGEAFRARAALFAGARASIDVATYYVQGDTTGHATRDALIAAARRGVAVRLIADEYVTSKKEFEGLGARTVIEELRAAGVQIRLWRDPARPYDAQHRKLLVVDGESAVIGGRNYADHYAGSAWRDVELLLTGPTAAEARAVFDRSFAMVPEPAFVAGRSFHATAPIDVADHPNFLYLLQAVRAATRTIDIENAYYFSHDAVLRALVAARRRGVRVRVFTNSVESNDLDFANWRLYTGFLPMIEAGIELYLRRGRGRTLHAKYFVSDGEWVSIGSSNLDYYSPRHCTECNLQVRSRELGALLTARFEDGLPEAERVTDPGTVRSVLATLGFSRRLDAALRDQQ